MCNKSAECYTKSRHIELVKSSENPVIPALFNLRKKLKNQPFLTFNQGVAGSSPACLMNEKSDRIGISEKKALRAECLFLRFVQRLCNVFSGTEKKIPDLNHSPP